MWIQNEIPKGFKKPPPTKAPPRKPAKRIEIVHIHKKAT